MEKERKGDLLKFEELPELLQDNEYITDSHRPLAKKYSACIYSVFQFHSETGNIWTHLIGAVGLTFLMLTFLSLPANYFNTTGTKEQIAIMITLFSSFSCMLCSTIYHVFACHQHMMEFVKLDYIGISLSVTGNAIGYSFYSFYCQSGLQKAFITAELVLGTICLVVVCKKRFAAVEYRSKRAFLFAVFIILALFPFSFESYRSNPAITDEAKHMALVYALNLAVGAIFFATRIPECFFPGKFNIFFQSHQIFHVFILIGMVGQSHVFFLLHSRRKEIGYTCIS